MSLPEWSFACELPAGPLARLFADPTVIETLAALNAGVALGTLDLSLERADVVRRLNAAGVPVVAWLLLPEDQGYWFNAENVREATDFYRRFRLWSVEQGLTWAGIGLDIEFDQREVKAFMSGRARAVLPKALRRAFDTERVHRVEQAYAALVTQIRSDGYPVESYEIPFMADERGAGSSLLRRILGLVDVPVDRDVFMLYSSFLGKLGPALLWSYGPETSVIGIGSTGGGVELGAQMPVLTWDALVRDLRYARQLGKPAFVFSLEGCVRQGYLVRLVGLDRNAPTPPPAAAELSQVRRLRQALAAALWASAHPLVVLGGVMLAARLLRRAGRDR